MIVRRLIVVVVALVLAIQIVRNAAVEALSPRHPSMAVSVWKDHPLAEISLGLAEIGQASRDRRQIDPLTFKAIDDAAAKSPLSPEPFLVRGVQEATVGNAQAAEGAFLAAQRRDPRSLPAAYFLAEYYFRHRQNLAGLEQTALLARLSANGETIAPFVAAYARDPANWAEMRALFRTHADLETPVLTVLARDPGSTDAIVAISDPSHRAPGNLWVPMLLNTLVANGEYARAKELWSSIGGGKVNGELLHDAGFTDSVSPPPFNWTFAQSTVGLAERQSGGRLHVIFYGNQDGPLASEIVLLPPGTYHLRMQLTGPPSHPETLQWSIRCANSTDPIGSVSLLDAASHGWTFRVPSNCPAQWLQLSGASGDIAQQSEATIAGLGLAAIGGGA